jgi:hypothetical protein
MYNGSPNWWDIEIEFSRHKELLQEAEKERLAKTFLIRQKKPARLVDRALGWLGSQMVGWGLHLQSRCGSQSTCSDKEQLGC